MVDYQPFDSASSSSSSSRSQTSSDSSSSGGSNEGKLSLQYGMSADDGTYTSEHDRELEEIDVNSKHIKKSTNDLELFADEQDSSSEVDAEYGEDDIRKPKRSRFLPPNLNSLKTAPIKMKDAIVNYDWKNAPTKTKDAILDFDWSEKKNLLKILYFVLGFIAFVLVIHLPVAAKKRARAKALLQDEDQAIAADAPNATYAPSIFATNPYTELYSGTGTGTMQPNTYWWQDAPDRTDDGMFNETLYPSSPYGTNYPSAWAGSGTFSPIDQWAGDKNHKPWYQGSYHPTIWSSTYEPSVDVELSQAEKDALVQVEIEKENEAEQAVKEAEAAEKEAEEAEEAAKKAEEEAKAAEEAAKKAEEAKVKAEEEAKAAEDAVKEAEQAVEISTPREPKKPVLPGLSRAVPSQPPTSPPTPGPTPEPTEVPTPMGPTESPTTGEPTTAAPVAWWVGWDGTWAPSNAWSETSTWAPTTFVPTTTEEKLAAEAQVETMEDGA